MRIQMDPNAVQAILDAADEAAAYDDLCRLHSTLSGSFAGDQRRRIERAMVDGDADLFVTETIEQWAGEAPAMLLEVLERRLADLGFEINFDTADVVFSRQALVGGNHANDDTSQGDR